MTLSICINLTHKQYAEIEEYCLNKALTISDYFATLHELNIQHEWTTKKENAARVSEFHDKFETLGYSLEGKEDFSKEEAETEKKQKKRLKQ